ncbi:Nucleolar protein 16 [Entamoeba marina]
MQNKPTRLPKTVNNLTPKEEKNMKWLGVEMVWYMRSLHEKYGEDVNKMFRDVKLNYLQYTKTKLKNMLEKYLDIKNKMDLEEKIGDVDQFNDIMELGINDDDIDSDDEMLLKVMEEFNIENVEDEENEGEENEEENNDNNMGVEEENENDDNMDIDEESEQEENESSEEEEIENQRKL